jgi:hypothetical protein
MLISLKIACIPAICFRMYSGNDIGADTFKPNLNGSLKAIEQIA